MKQYKVEITKEALQDMEDIYNYIAIDLLAPDNAMGQYNRIADEILTLDTFPERFRIKNKILRIISLIPLVFVGLYSLLFILYLAYK